MAMGLGELNGWVNQIDWPRVQCPTCQVGTVGFADATHHLDGPSREIAELAHKNLGPADELSGTFVGALKCDNRRCLQTFSMAGDWQLIFNEGDPRLGEFGEIFRIRYVNPPLKLIHVPTATPNAVKQAIESASEILWLSPSAAANRLRQAVEELLSALKVKKTTKGKSGKRLHLRLHDRIGVYRVSTPDVADALEAVKWIGNEGSHDATLTVADVLVGAAILDLAIRALYDKGDAQLRAKVRTINRAGGLPSRRR